MTEGDLRRVVSALPQSLGIARGNHTQAKNQHQNPKNIRFAFHNCVRLPLQGE